jgi:hypothetical protein
MSAPSWPSLGAARCEPGLALAGRRLAVVRGFARYRAIDPGHEVPQSAHPARAVVSQHRICTRRTVTALMAAARRLRTATGGDA